MTGSLQVKKGMFYIVVSFKNSVGKWSTKWIATNLPVKGNKRQADKMLEETLRTFASSNVKFDKDIPFIDLLEKWLATVKMRLDQITYEGYNHTIEKHIKPYFEPLRLKTSAVHTEHIQYFYNTKLENGRLDGKGGLAPASIKQFHAVILQALEYAKTMDIIVSNPATKVILPRRREYHASFYNANEVVQMLEICDNAQLRPILLLTTTYGLRRSEVAGLKWQAIDFKNDTVTIEHTVVQNFTVVRKDKTKNTASHRTYPLVGEIKQALIDIKMQQNHNRVLLQGGYHNCDYVFCWPDGRSISPDWMSKAFAKLLKKHELRRIRFHDLRHSCASILLANGYTLKDIQEWLGHSDIKMTGNVYGHLEVGRKKDMAAHFGQILEAEKVSPQESKIG